MLYGRTLARQHGWHKSLSGPLVARRRLLTLAIESSCDDTSVAVLETQDDSRQGSNGKAATLHFHEKITADNHQYRGIHPIVTLDSHRANLAPLVAKALIALPEHAESPRDDHWGSIAVPDGSSLHPVLRRKPDFISVTRGPGLLASLTCGIDTAKGLAVAWQIPLLGVHHMQAHALTPRLVSALEALPRTAPTPGFPFLSLLVSGGHTLLIHSRGLAEHEILATTGDIAIGDCLDKVGRLVLPPELISQNKDTMYGRFLSSFAFPNGPSDFADYKPPASRGEEVAERPPNEWGWTLRAALADTKTLSFSFSGLQSRIDKLITSKPEPYILSDAERRAFAREALRISFEHLASRTVLALQSLRGTVADAPPTLVLSGGVAANSFLRHLFRAFLDVRGFEGVELVFPPVELCTDNAAMIAWAGVEMYRAGYRSDLGIGAVRKWRLDTIETSPR